MEKLCLSNRNDIKQLLDLTSSDYCLNNKSYIPRVATSPFLFESSYIIMNPLKISDDNSMHICFVPWGFVEHSKRIVILSEFQITKNHWKRLLQIFEKFKNSNEGIFWATNSTESALNHCSKHQSWFSKSDKVWLTIKLLRKQGILEKATENLFFKCQN